MDVRSKKSLLNKNLAGKEFVVEGFCGIGKSSLHILKNFAFLMFITKFQVMFYHFRSV
jgi:hypothetical protein